MGLTTVVSADKDHKLFIVDASLLLTDVIGLGNELSARVENPRNPLRAYRLEPTKTYFGSSKAFPKNVIIEADQTFASVKPDAINSVVDPRAIQFRVKYNFSELPFSPDYMPRLVDDRLGYWSDPHIAFDGSNVRDNRVMYAVRWNLKASDPSKPMSPAVKPIVYTLSNRLPEEFRRRSARRFWSGTRRSRRSASPTQSRSKISPTTPVLIPTTSATT